MPRKGGVVVYLPQGHLDHLGDAPAPSPAAVPPHVFCRVVDVTLHADASTDEVYAQLSLLPENEDYSQQRPSQELVAKDLHGTEWKFRHIYRGQPRRHLLTTGWSAFVNKKKLVSGDAVLFLRGDDGELRLGVRRSVQLKNGSAFPALYSQCSNLGTLANVAHAVATKSMFQIFYNPRMLHYMFFLATQVPAEISRLSQSEFIVPYWKFTKSFSQPFSVGLRFKMRYESEDAAERRYTGIITGTGDADPMWRGSKWKCLLLFTVNAALALLQYTFLFCTVKVRWDDDGEFRRPNRVSPWEIELTSSASGSHLAAPTSKRMKPYLPHANPEFTVPHGGGRPDFAESAQLRKVLQGQELLGYRTHDGTAVATSQPCEARNLQYIDERGCSNNVSNNVLGGVPSHGVRTPLGIPYHCSGFGESQRFQKVLQGQEVFRPYRGSLVDARMRNGGFQQQDGPYASGLLDKWRAQQQHAFGFGPPAPVLPSQPSLSPPSVLMFQQADPKVSRFEFGHGHLDKNVDDPYARFVSAEGIGRGEQTLSLRPHLGSEVIDSRVAVENKGVAPTNSCKIFGISLAEKVRARDEMGCDDGGANYPSPTQPLKQQVPKSLGNSCATVHEQRPVVGRAIDVQQWI
uniref:Auxin response factor n=1 Tax=Aegilops tauschii TaxID=37682 RepID=M8C030_AEGTA